MNFKTRIRYGLETDSQKSPWLLGALLTAECFLLITIVYSFITQPVKVAMQSLMLCSVMAVLLVAPWAVEMLFRLKFPPRLKLLLMILILGGPILGKIYKFYYRFTFWDKFLHTLSGFLFAIIGAALPDVVDSNNTNHSPALKAVCAICFTLAVGVVWEFFEYAMDTFFSMDMQQDTIITSVNSYLLGTETGVAGSLNDIQTVIVNGEELAIGGYLDIGLIDTMTDMMVCTVGGLFYCLCAKLCESKVRLFAWIKGLTPYSLCENDYVQ